MNKKEEIIKLYSDGMPVGRIARKLGVKHQMVLGVLGRHGCLLPKTTHVGIELECYNVPIPTDCYSSYRRRKNLLKSDGSIEGDYSAEFASRHLTPATLFSAIQSVCEFLNTKGAKVNKSCGFHVHFFRPYWKKEVVERIWSNYQSLQDEINEMLPESRRNNRYCRPIKEWYQIDFSYRYNRYSAINLTAIRKSNSIEFRQHSGTTDPHKIIMWIRLLSRLIHLSEQGKILNTLADLGIPKLQRYINKRKNKFKR